MSRSRGEQPIWQGSTPSELRAVWQRIESLEDSGGFPDVKLLQRRFQFLEDRLARLELTSAALVEVTSALIESYGMHFMRHGLGCSGDEQPDVIGLKRAMHRMKAYREAAKPKATPRVPSAPSVRKQSAPH